MLVWSVYIDYADDDDHALSDMSTSCVISPLSTDNTDPALLPVYVTAFHLAPDTSTSTDACNNRSAPEIHVISVTDDVTGRSDDVTVTRRLPRIRVNIVHTSDGTH